MVLCHAIVLNTTCCPAVLLTATTANHWNVQVTLLAAGFVIGPGGHSIRAICERSGANIQVRGITGCICNSTCGSCSAFGSVQTASSARVQSCTRSAPWAAPGRDCILRAFMIMGSDTERTAAKGIIASAVKLYQDLFTGRLGALCARLCLCAAFLPTHRAWIGVLDISPEQSVLRAL